MTMTRFERLLPLAGVLAGLLWALVAILTMNEPAVTDGAARHADWFADHKGLAAITAFACGYFAVVMLLFAAAVRGAIRPAGSTYATAAFAGGIAVALSIALAGAVFLAEVDAADKHNADALTTLGFVDGDLWVPLVASLAAFYLATGLGALRSRALPKWWAIVTVVLGALCLTGVGGIGVYPATAIWLIVTSIALYRRQTGPEPAPAAELTDMGLRVGGA